MQKMNQVNYWLSVVAIGLVLGFGIREVRAWQNPSQTPPSGNIAGPITTGTDQIKTGSLGVNGSVSIGGGLRMAGATFRNCDLKTSADGTLTCGTDSTGSGGISSISNGSCGAGQVVKSISTTGTATCVTDATVAVPTCSTGQVLKGNGTALSCVSDATVTVPTCTTGQVLTGGASGLTCVSDATGSGGISSITNGGCGTGQVVKSISAAGAVTCAAPVPSYTNLPSGSVAGYCIKNGNTSSVKAPATASAVSGSTVITCACPSGWGLMQLGPEQDQGSGAAWYYYSCLKS